MAGDPAIVRPAERVGDDGGGLRIEPLHCDRLGDALSLLASGRTGVAPELAIRQAVLGLGEDVDQLARGLWMAWRGNEPVAAAGVVPGAGGTAMVFVSPPRAADGVVASEGASHGASCADAAALVRAACAAQPRQVRLFQALLTRGHEARRLALESAGFRFLAQLMYMQRRTARQVVDLALPDDLSVQTWRPALRDDFAAAIDASYEQTLDCPALVGMRGIDDVLEGHRAVGVFRDDLWLLVRQRGRPAGVMLMSMTGDGRTAELVYLGLCPSLRGRGLGRVLMEHGLSRAGRAGAEKMVLAVDEDNGPALKLYESLRFVAIARRTALVMAAR